MSPLTLAEFASMGGKARAKKLSKARRIDIGKQAAKARWGKPAKLPRKKPVAARSA